MFSKGSNMISSGIWSKTAKIARTRKTKSSGKTNLHSCYVKNALVFSKSEACNSFRYVVMRQTEFHELDWTKPILISLSHLSCPRFNDAGFR